MSVLGELKVLQNGQAMPLPTSKRTRALLAFLAITARPHRRDRLCEIFWESPSDPRGALRWSLSKLRSVVNFETEYLKADRERVRLDVADIDLDIKRLREAADKQSLTVDSLKALADKFDLPLLSGLDLPDQALYQKWLVAERNEWLKTRAKVLSRLVDSGELSYLERLQWAREWEKADPFNPKAATSLVTLLELMNFPVEVASLTREFKKRFMNAGIGWSSEARTQFAASGQPVAQSEVADIPTLPEPSDRELLFRQRIQFCRAYDGVRLAYASIGKGKPIVKAANWLSHLEYDWDAPIWSPLYRELAKDFRFIRYDERGNGLSDWEVDDISFTSFVTDLETVVASACDEKFALLGISQGAAVSIDYAVRNPDKVSHLILFGGYAAGWRHNATEAIVREREAVMTLTEVGWGQDNSAYRHIFSSTFMPDATPDELTWFNDFQRLTTSPQNAVRFLEVFSRINVLQQLSKITVPTLVIHSMGDRRIPVEVGRELAASIPNAEFVGLESNGHLLLGREPASAKFLATIRDFLNS